MLAMLADFAARRPSAVRPSRPDRSPQRRAIGRQRRSDPSPHPVARL